MAILWMCVQLQKHILILSNLHKHKIAAAKDEIENYNL